jgi:aspartate kinase
MRVFKFGGASVKNAEAVRNVGTVLQEFGGEEVLVIVSAMGKTTNSLELLAKAFYEGDANKYEIYKEVKKFHDDIIGGLLISSASHTYDDIENLFIELECELENTPFEDFDQVYDQIVSYGEIFSSRILSAYLNESGIKNR